MVPEEYVLANERPSAVFQASDVASRRVRDPGTAATPRQSDRDDGGKSQAHARPAAACGDGAEERGHAARAPSSEEKRCVPSVGSAGRAPEVRGVSDGRTCTPSARLTMPETGTALDGAERRGRRRP